MFLSILHNVYSLQARYQSFLYFFCSYVLSLNVFVPHCGGLIVLVGLNHFSLYSWAVPVLLFKQRFTQSIIFIAGYYYHFSIETVAHCYTSYCLLHRVISRELYRPGLVKVRFMETITYYLLLQSAIATVNTWLNIYAHFFARERVAES